MTHLGGTFAPPLSDEAFRDYAGLIEAQSPGPVRDALVRLHDCCKQWWNLPDSQGAATPHPAGVGIIVPLDEPIANQLFDAIPWREELDAIQALFDKIPPENKDLRNMAFHLLWHVKELEMDREPITADKLKGITPGGR